jgi:hypothetical protein
MGRKHSEDFTRDLVDLKAYDIWAALAEALALLTEEQAEKIKKNYKISDLYD